jgi:hypothetical protein
MYQFIWITPGGGPFLDHCDAGTAVATSVRNAAIESVEALCLVADQASHNLPIGISVEKLL